MSFVYFNIWQIKQTKPKDFAMGLIGFGKDIKKSDIPCKWQPGHSYGVLRAGSSRLREATGQHR